MLPQSKTDIILMSIQQINSLNKNVLLECCKMLGLRQYSKLCKSDLVRIIYDSTNIERSSLLLSEKEISEKLHKIERENKSIISDNARSDNPINLTNLRKFIKQGLTTKMIAETFYNSCKMIKFTDKKGENKTGYEPLYIAKNCSRKLNDVLSESDLSYGQKLEIKAFWDELVRPIHTARRLSENAHNHEISIKPEKTFNTENILQWAIENITSKSRYLKGLSLSIFSGRRMIEIYGNTEYSLNEDKLTIFCQGLAKKKPEDNTCNIVTLIDPNLWLESINNLEREYTPKQINNNISREMGKHLPDILKENGISQFKDCRDFYATVVYQSLRSLGVNEPLKFVSDLLGHNSLDGTLYYRRFYADPTKDNNILQTLKLFLRQT
jgi:integrase